MSALVYERRLLATRPDPAGDLDAAAAFAERVVRPPRYVATSATQPPGTVRVVCISDTHGRHESVEVPAGDVLVHAGDMSVRGKAAELANFARWFAAQPHAGKVIVAGNHDVSLDLDRCAARGTSGESIKRDFIETVRASRGVYLEDSAAQVCGLRFWGSPWQPAYGDWAFNLGRGEPCLSKWQLIPDDCDVLVTHGPPFGRGDMCSRGQRAGCVDLLHQVQDRVRPRLHVFGHIHEDGGATSDGHTDFINASTCDLAYRPTNPAFVVDLPHSLS